LCVGVAGYMNNEARTMVVFCNKSRRYQPPSSLPLLSSILVPQATCLPALPLLVSVPSMICASSLFDLESSMSDTTVTVGRLNGGFGMKGYSIRYVLDFLPSCRPVLRINLLVQLNLPPHILYFGIQASFVPILPTTTIQMASPDLRASYGILGVSVISI
jgi:hypothetical protein